MHFHALVLSLAAIAVIGSPALAQDPITGTSISGHIDSITIDNPADVFSGGRIVVAGQSVIIPRNLLIDLPANRLTLQQLFADAPSAARTAGVTGLAKADGPQFTSGFASVLANRQAGGAVIAGDLFIEKGVDVVMGKVTYINHDEGYMRINGTTRTQGADPEDGVLLRINDPTGRHTIQSGRGIAPGNEDNGSPDLRFGLDPDNYTITFTTGYPAALPSNVPINQRPGFLPADGGGGGGNQGPGNGGGGGGGGGGAPGRAPNDPFAPTSNRPLGAGQGGVAGDSRRFAPILVGDYIHAEGNWEDVAGVQFVSAHTLTVLHSLTTRPAIDQPDYMTFDEVEWDAPGFQNQRVRLLLIGFTTLPDSQLTVYSLHNDPLSGEERRRLLTTTVGNPNNVNVGAATTGGIWKVRYDLDFIEADANAIDTDNAPVQFLQNALSDPLWVAAHETPDPLDFDTIAELRSWDASSFADNFGVLSPMTREIQAITEHSRRLAPGVITRDINGNEATNGQYLTPVGIGFAEFVEIDLGALTSAYNFEGIPWNLARQLAPGGFVDNSTEPFARLDPFPASNQNPSTQGTNGLVNAATLNSVIASRVSAYYTAAADGGVQVGVLPTNVAAPAGLQVQAARLAAPVSLPPLAASTLTFERTARGDGFVNIFVQSLPGLSLQARNGLGFVVPLTEPTPGNYFAQATFLPASFSSAWVIQAAGNLQIPAASKSAIDILDVRTATYSTINRTLQVTATSTDAFRGVTLEAFDDKGTLLGTLNRGGLTLRTNAIPASITVRSSSGGSAVRPVTVVANTRTTR